MSEILKRLKSKTYGWALVPMILAYIETNADMIRPLLHEWYGPTMFVIGLVAMLIRELTKTPVSEK